MYVKKIELNGHERIVVLFIQDSGVATTFVPTHPNNRKYPGAAGYSDEIAKWYIKSQEMVKKYELDEITQSVGENQTATHPGSPPPQP